MADPIEVRMSELADSMTSATLTAWLKHPGDRVTAGEPIAEVETDKTTVEIEAPADGVLTDIRVAAGTRDIAVGALLAVVREEARAGESVPTGTSALPLVEIRLPELAEGMAAATLSAWLKKSGDPVTAGEPIAEVETDKTTVELEAPADGVLADIRVAAGAEAVAVGTVLALVRKGAPGEAATQGGPAENAGSPEADASVPTPPSGAVDTAEGLPAAATAGGAADAVAPPSAGADARIRKPPAGGVGVDAPVGATTPPDDAGPVFVEAPATPLARRMADLAGLDLCGVTGSGVGGRVMKVDVERLLRSAREGAAAPGPAAGPAAPAPPPAPASDLPHTDRPLTAMRRVTAQRMAEAKRSAPHFYLEIECAVDRLLALRDEAAATGDAASPAGDDGVPTVNDVVVRAAALALREVPLANSAWTGDAVRVYDRVDLAVAVTTPAGLVTPVVRAADTKPLAAIAAELRRLAKDARAGRLQPADYQGGTCTISNLGMYGVASLYAILNPPQSCILGVGAIAERPVVRDGVVAVGSTMTVTLSADHRAIDGATGAELLRALKSRLENPRQLLELEQHGRTSERMAIGKAARLREKLQKIERADVIAGLRRMDSTTRLKPSTKYDLLYDGRTYPPKEVVRYAYCQALRRRGEPSEDPERVLSSERDGFNGGGKGPLSANAVLSNLRFDIIEK